MLKSTIVLTFLTVLNQVAAFCIQIIVASHFGAGTNLDGYLAGITIPQYITTILTTTISAVFIPVYISYYARSRDEAWNVFEDIFKMNLYLSIVITLLGIVFAHYLIEISVPGLSAGTKKIAWISAVIFWPSVLFSSIQYMFIYLYQAKKLFSSQAIILFCGTVFQLAIVIIFVNALGIYSLPLSSLAGIIVPTIIFSRHLFQQRLKFKINFKDPGVLEYLKLSIPLIISNIAVRISPVIERFFASDMSSGSISQLNYALKIITVSSTVLTIGLSTVIFPSLAESLSSNDMENFKKTCASGLKNMWLILAPVIAFGLVLSLPVISLVFERGAFSHNDSIEVSKLFQIYMISLLGSALGAVTGKALYALKMMKIMSFIGVLETVLYIFYTRHLVLKFGIYGLALGYSFYFIISFIWHLIVIQVRIKSSLKNNLSVSIFKTFLCAIISGIGVLGFKILISDRVLAVIFGLIAGIIMYIGLQLVFKSEEIILLKNKLLRNYFKRYYISGLSD